MFQDPNIYALSLGNNVSLIQELQDEQSIIALQNLGLDKVLREKFEGDELLTRLLTKEFDTDGVMLSGGETQKVALARLFHAELGLLLLDEPSSALDPLAESELTSMLYDRSRSTTTIMVAHRLSTVRRADRIYVMDHGSVVEEGAHRELMELGGLYQRMFNSQAEHYQ